uniref:Transposase n=1 Tax=Steinernema glaseri TaxID=37863 RepID=A0A1I7YRD9_9BILA
MTHNPIVNHHLMLRGSVNAEGKPSRYPNSSFNAKKEVKDPLIDDVLTLALKSMIPHPQIRLLWLDYG